MKLDFRAWDKTRNEIVDVMDIDFSGKKVGVCNVPKRLLDGRLYTIRSVERDWDEVELMQGWTPEYQPELTIYEGDIINVHWFYARVHSETLGVYEDEECLKGLEVVEENGMLGFYYNDGFTPLGFVPAHEESFEVIGNTWEDGDLLDSE